MAIDARGAACPDVRPAEVVLSQVPRDSPSRRLATCRPVVRPRGSVGCVDKERGFVADTILGVPVKSAPKEPTRVLDTVIDLTDKREPPSLRRRHRSEESTARAGATQAGATTAAPPPSLTRARKRRAERTPGARSTGIVSSAPPRPGRRRRAHNRDAIQPVTAHLVRVTESLAVAVRAQAAAVADLRAGLGPPRE